MFEDVGDVGVPHGYREQVLVGGVEPVEYGLHLGPGVSFSTGGFLAAEDGHLGVGALAGIGREGVGPQVHGVHGGVGVDVSVGLQEDLGHAVGMGGVASRGDKDIQQLGHDRLPSGQVR